MKNTHNFCMHLVL